MNKDLEKLLDYLKVEQIDKYLFIGQSPAKPERIFGGQVLAQALNAAIRTVEGEALAHSMHAYFLRPGNPQQQIVYEVDPIRDGRSFTTRRVVAKQNGRAIFNTSVSFHEPEHSFEHQVPAPSAGDPEDLETDWEYHQRMARDHPEVFNPPRSQAIDRRPTQRRNFVSPKDDIGEPHTADWMRANGPLGEELTQHQTLLAYMSDMGLIGVSLRPHPTTTRQQDLLFASLDHALWFHQPFRADEWLLHDHDSPIAHGARSFCRGSFYNQQGQLVASVAQEALIRRRKSM